MKGENIPLPLYVIANRSNVADIFGFHYQHADFCCKFA
jgi:hypothetical protein